MPPLVSVVCITYNHEDYIQKCLNGFLMQKTNFRFEILVHDDASIDNTATIIRKYEEEYASLFRVVYQKENQYSQGVCPCEDILFPMARGKYIALCEGDDYWTDPYKLQKQIDFLEANPEYGLCYTQTQFYSESDGKEKQIWGGPYTDFENIVKVNTIPTLTAVARTELILKYIQDVEPQKHNWKMGDYPIWLWFACCSKIAYIPEITGCYRVSCGSVSHSKTYISQLEFMQSSMSIKLFFLKYRQASARATIGLINLESIQINLQIASLHRDEYLVRRLQKDMWRYRWVNLCMLKRVKFWLMLLFPNIFTRCLQYKYYKCDVKY